MSTPRLLSGALLISASALALHASAAAAADDAYLKAAKDYIATVSAPVTWEEVEKGVRIEDFRMENVPARIAERGDLWKPLLAAKGRFSLEKFV